MSYIQLVQFWVEMHVHYITAILSKLSFRHYNLCTYQELHSLLVSLWLYIARISNY